MKFRNALLTATVLAAPLALPHLASAQPVTGLYVAGGIGYNQQQKSKETNFTASGQEEPGYARISIRGGYTGEAAVGYGFGNGVRVEVEGDYYNNRNNNAALYFNGYPAAGAKAGGYEQKYGAFLNAYYDFAVPGVAWVTPYLGVGAGWQVVDYNNLAIDDLSVSKHKDAFAYQGIAGLAFPVAPVPGLSATVEYRFMGLASTRKLNGSTSTGIPVSFDTQRDYNNSVLVGMRYAFGVTPPPPPAPAPVPVAAPAPAPAKTYLVFFDWDKYNLTPRALDIIAQAASDSKTQSTTTIAVNGYTDTSGTPAYNQGLSVRRAKAVAAQLVADGVPESEITAQGFGDTDLLVPTGPGVREPQNRRVQIVLQ
jgi:outer membrane protein OmpA-like peptidoglycan-associated protein